MITLDEAAKVGDILLAGATIGLLYVGWKNIPILLNQLRVQAEVLHQDAVHRKAQFDQQKMWETVRACQKFTTDAQIQGYFELIQSANKGTLNDRDFTELNQNPSVVMAARKLLNYFDTLAIGVKENIYIEDVIKHHFEEVVLRMVYEAFILGISGTIPDANISWKVRAPVASPAEYKELVEMYERWYPARAPSPAPHFD